MEAKYKKRAIQFDQKKQVKINIQTAFENRDSSLIDKVNDKLKGQTLADIFHGIKYPTNENLKIIAEIYGLEESDLTTGILRYTSLENEIDSFLSLNSLNESMIASKAGLKKYGKRVVYAFKSGMPIPKEAFEKISQKFPGLYRIAKKYPYASLMGEDIPRSKDLDNAIGDPRCEYISKIISCLFPSDIKILCENINKRVIQNRENNFIKTQADRIGISSNYLLEIRKAQKCPNAKLLCEIETKLSIPFELLLEGTYYAKNRNRNLKAEAHSKLFELGVFNVVPFRDVNEDTSLDESKNFLLNVNESEDVIDKKVLIASNKGKTDALKSINNAIKDEEPSPAVHKVHKAIINIYEEVVSSYEEIADASIELDGSNNNRLVNASTNPRLKSRACGSGSSEPLKQASGVGMVE